MNGMQQKDDMHIEIFLVSVELHFSHKSSRWLGKKRKAPNILINKEIQNNDPSNNCIWKFTLLVIYDWTCRLFCQEKTYSFFSHNSPHHVFYL